MPFHQFQQHVEPRLRRQRRIELVVSLIRIFEISKYPNDTVHGVNCSMPAGDLQAFCRRCQNGSFGQRFSIA